MRGYPGTYPRRGGSGFLVVLFLLLGLYLINYTIKFVIIPASLSAAIDKWIILAGGVFLIIAAINQLRLNRYRMGY